MPRKHNFHCHSHLMSMGKYIPLSFVKQYFNGCHLSSWPISFDNITVACFIAPDNYVSPSFGCFISLNMTCLFLTRRPFYSNSWFSQYHAWKRTWHSCPSSSQLLSCNANKLKINLNIKMFSSKGSYSSYLGISNYKVLNIQCFLWKGSSSSSLWPLFFSRLTYQKYFLVHWGWTRQLFYTVFQSFTPPPPNGDLNVTTTVLLATLKDHPLKIEGEVRLHNFNFHPSF